jgi:uncharacterized protein YfaP (DUF2135 family)
MRTKKGTVLLALVALAAFTVTATVGGSASASSGNAVAAKKKCKKKKASSAKKKKCKKKKGGGQPQVVRATLTWAPNDEDASADDADLDLFAFDPSGNRAGNGSDTIPNSTLSADVTGRSGTETFSAPHGVVLSFGVCYTVGGSVHTPFTITYVTSDGVTHTDSQRPGSSFHYEYPGGAPIPSFCSD